MIRFVRSAVVLAGFMAIARPGLADPSAALAQAYATSEPQAPQPQSKPAASAPEAAAPADRGKTNDIISVGFGWG